MAGISWEWVWQREALAVYPKLPLEAGVAALLHARLMKWQPSLGGVPVAVAQVQLLSRVGALHEDMPLVHVQADVQWKVFRPAAGSLLAATVSSVGIDHVGLRLGPFSASVARARLPPEFEWQPDAGPAFVYAGVPVLQLAVDSRVIFKVLGVETRHGALNIIGDMTAPGTG